ncbi:hypothetical protein FRC14_001872 [Serendipita sp. 396]|nr:hypothetical protein FRC14_001872 [Serendipita sp. 396]
MLEWTVRTHCKEYELGGSFSILLFFFKLPNVPDDPSKWPLDSHYIGAFHAMVDYPPEEGNEDRFISGFVHINKPILKRSPQQSPPSNALKVEHVVPFLKKNLYWGVMKVRTRELLPILLATIAHSRRQADGTVPDLSSFPSLEVMVMATPLTFYPGSEYPEAGEPVLYPEITRGKPGGAKD